MTVRVILSSGHEISVDDEIAEEILNWAKQRVGVEAERRTIEFGGTDRDGNEFDGSVFSDHIVGVFR
ncbi:MAG: hypothetical protein ACXVAM_14100 [Vulcanimicrobiaceae bacterium]